MIGPVRRSPGGAFSFQGSAWADDLAGPQVRGMNAVVLVGQFQMQGRVQQARPAQAPRWRIGAQRAPEADSLLMQAFIAVHAVHAGSNNAIATKFRLKVVNDSQIPGSCI